LATDFAVIVNPAAGHGRSGRIWPEVSARMRELGLRFDAQTTSGPGEATAFAAEAQRAGYATVVALGGDGTVSEVVNGLFANGKPSARLGILSSGTGSDFVRTLGIPRGVEGVESLTAGVRRIDVGLVRNESDGTSRYFVNAGDVGLGAEAADRVNRGSKALGGFMSFLVGAVTTIATYQCKEIEFSLDNEPSARQRIALIVVANGRCFAGGMRVAPHAELDDGLFDVAILAEGSKAALIGQVLPAVYSGKHIGHPLVRYLRATRVRIRPGPSTRLELDGEVVGSGAVEFQIVPDALEVAAPKPTVR
jgi:diacylglycerol kinase (ATP)